LPLQQWIELRLRWGARRATAGVGYARPAFYGGSLNRCQVDYRQIAQCGCARRSDRVAGDYR